MLLKYFNYPLVLCLSLLVGCINNESRFSIDKLPEATIDQPYSVVIRIWGGVMPNKENLSWQITPENSGLNIRPTTYWYDEIELYGTPKAQGDISIHLKGGGYGSPPYHFDKTFILKVNAPSNELKEP